MSTPRTLDRTLLALADPTRRAILQRLSAGEARVTDVAKPFSMSLNAVSKHILVLERAKLVQRRKEGRDGTQAHTKPDHTVGARPSAHLIVRSHQIFDPAAEASVFVGAGRVTRAGIVEAQAAPALARESDGQRRHCTACFDGRSPVDVPLDVDKFALERG